MILVGTRTNTLRDPTTTFFLFILVSNCALTDFFNWNSLKVTKSHGVTRKIRKQRRKAYKKVD